MSRLLRTFAAAVFLSLTWSAPVHAALFAQTEQSPPVLEYGAAIVATGLVLLVVCWPARRRQ